MPGVTSTGVVPRIYCMACNQTQCFCLSFFFPPYQRCCPKLCAIWKHEVFQKQSQHLKDEHRKKCGMCVFRLEGNLPFITVGCKHDNCSIYQQTFKSTEPVMISPCSYLVFYTFSSAHLFTSAKNK